MHELNLKLKALTDEMWKIKDYKENISVEELLNFCSEFYAYHTFWIDMVDSIIQKGGLLEKEKDEIVDMIRSLNDNTYNRIIIDDLMEMDCKSGENYLCEIISIPQLYIAFKDDFSHHPQYTKYYKLLKTVI